MGDELFYLSLSLETGNSPPWRVSVANIFSLSPSSEQTGVILGCMYVYNEEYGVSYCWFALSY